MNLNENEIKCLGFKYVFVPRVIRLEDLVSHNEDFLHNTFKSLIETYCLYIVSFSHMIDT